LADNFDLPHHFQQLVTVSKLRKRGRCVWWKERVYVKKKRRMCVVEGERRKEISVWMLLMEREGKKCFSCEERRKEISAPRCVECCVKR
jgi:hypothetical protein